jgi:hypothetical protein
MQQNCGTTWQYERKIGKLVADYKAKGVEVIAIHPSPGEGDAEIKGMLEQRNLPLPILDDKPQQALTKYVGARCSPTFFIVDKKGNLAYRGAFDQRPSDTSNGYVRSALDALLANKPVPTAETRAFG